MADTRSVVAAVEQVRAALDRADLSIASKALPDLREALEQLTLALDEAMAAAVLDEEGVSLRAVGALAGLSENAVGPRLGRTQALGPYADDKGRVTAKGVERAVYDRETGSPPRKPVTAGTEPLRFRPRRTPR